MKSLWCFIILLGAMTDFSAYANSKRNKLTNEPSGVISFENAAVDFGTLKRGQKVVARFTYKNVGQGPLTINGVQAPCDCTAVSGAKGQTISPGETGVIEVTFDSTDYSGLVTKAVTVVTNERSMPDRTLTISALINSDIEATPPLADFGEIILGEGKSLPIKVKNLTQNNLTLGNMTYNRDYIQVVSEKDGRDWILKVTLLPSAPLGFFKDTIYVKNNSPSLPDMPIPVRATIKGQITSTPSYVEFGAIASSKKSERQVSLAGSDLFDIKASKIELLINGSKSANAEGLLKVDVVKTSGTDKRLSLQLANPGNLSGSVHGKVNLETTNPKQKNMTIDFYAFFR
jgi:hypothetical protein